MSQLVVVTAVGKDRPGIVAALTGAVFGLGGNLDDAAMTQLHNTFATMISVQWPADRELDDLRSSLAPLAAELGLTVSVHAVDPENPTAAPADHLISVYGADHPGIVYRITERLAQRGVNITNMNTRLTGALERPVYVMLLEVVSGECELAGDLAEMARTLGVDITVQPLETETL